MTGNSSRSAAGNVGILCLAVAGGAALVLVGGMLTTRADVWRPAAVALAVSMAVALRSVPALQGYQFTAWIVAVVIAAMVYPRAFLRIGTIDLSDKRIIVAMVQLVMFGMGTQMSLRDFAGVAKMPWSVLVGIFCQFTIMPLVGFGLTKLFAFDDEIAAGVILIGCCSSGLASNVMAYLARANLALSITMTSVTTLLAPFVTPLWMKRLAGDRVDVSVLAMMADIIKLVVVPIGAALLHDQLKRTSPVGRRRVVALAAICAGWLLYLISGGYTYVSAQLVSDAQPWFLIVNFGAGAVLFGVLFHAVTHAAPWIVRAMPTASMFGIIYYTAVTTAAGRDRLLDVGGLLFLAAAIHNALGYVLGYWMSRGLGVDRNAARTVAFEVGLQNGGMASGIASSMDKLGTMGLAAAVFSPWMNVTGSILANYWRRRPIDETGLTTPTQ
jgi:BASS family bile acid:Na+ symporter